MKVEKVYELLEKLKKRDVLVSSKSKRLLKYIYQDIYLNYFEKAKEDATKRVIFDGAQYGSIRYNDTVKPFEEAQKHIGSFLDGNSSILSYFLELIDEKDDRFINLFFDKISTYFEIVDNHFYTEKDFKIYAFAFNIYTMLVAYNKHKDNYEIFEKIVEDASFLINCNGFGDKYSGNFSKLADRKEMIDAIVSCDCYLEIEYVRKLLVDVLEHIGYDYIYYKREVIDSDLAIINKIYSDYKDLCSLVSKDKLIDLETVVSSCILSGNTDRHYPYYAKNLLIGERLEFVNNQLSISFDEKEYRASAFSEISSFDYTFFEYLNGLDKYNNMDSFIVILSSIFDSDTYYEFNSKVKDVKEAISLFLSGDYSKSLELINGIDSEKHKKTIDGKMVSYLSNVMNPVKKETCIFRRMLSLYSDIYRDKDININSLMRDVHQESNLSNFDSSLNKRIDESIKDREMLRKIEAQRMADIKDTLDDMARVQGESVSTTSESGSLSSDINDKPKQKFKGFFGKK